ncbi:MAG: hypothetical protein F6K41_12795 [Symploca sp. SIO3E6]|nr:hypothetical protein [Caldora sp. SIO3E6]
MNSSPKITDSFSAKSWLILASVCLGLNPILLGVANAQDTSEAEPAETEPESSPRRLESFFEQERRPRFGAGDFLDSAINGIENFFPDPAKVSGFRSDPLSNPLATIPGIITVQSRDDNSPNFLNTDFDGGDLANLELTNAQPSSNLRLGTLTVNGNVTLNNGQTLQLNNVPATYNAGFSSRENTISGVLQVIDPNNPGNTILIQLPSTRVPNADANQPISSPGSLSIGLPTDR